MICLDYSLSILSQTMLCYCDQNQVHDLVRIVGDSRSARKTFFVQRTLRRLSVNQYAFSFLRCVIMPECMSLEHSPRIEFPVPARQHQHRPDFVLCML